MYKKTEREGLTPNNAKKSSNELKANIKMKLKAISNITYPDIEIVNNRLINI